MKYLQFYSKYFKLPSDFSDEATNNLQAPSPFGDGLIEISKDGRFTCLITGKTGNPTQFIQELYPTVSAPGANLIVSEDNRLFHTSLERAEDLINSFRRDLPLVKIAASKLGLSPKQLVKMPVFMDKRGFRYHYVSNYSESNTPLTLATFSDEFPLRTTQGVARPPKIRSQRVWLTANPIVAYMVEEFIGETAMCWPKERELQIFDYKRIFDGKDVVALHGELIYTYDESFYPFFENVRSCVKSFADVRYEAFCNGENFGSWIAKKQNLNTLFEEADKSKGAQPITKSNYEKYIRIDDVIDVQYGQSSARGYFFYGTNENKIAQSYPLSIDSILQTERNYRLRYIEPTRFNSDIKLTTDRVLSIGQSIKQLTPSNAYNLTRGLIKDHIYFENKETEALLSLWIMGTYVFSIFNAYPYLHINAAKGSGKTTLLELIEKCSFNGIMASRITSANLIQTVSDTQCTLCLDEFEKNTGGQGNTHTHILNSGYKRGGNYRRLRGSNTDSMNLYSPKVYASIDPIKTEALASRTLKIEMHRKPTHELINGWDYDDARTQKRINEIMSACYAIGLFNHNNLEYLLMRLPRQITLPSGFTVDGREKELITPLVIMAQIVDLSFKINGSIVENELYVALEKILFPEKEEELQRMKILAIQLREWGESPDQLPHSIKDDYYWISNKLWDNSGLLTHFEGSKSTLLDWLKSLNDNVKREATHLPGHGTESCIGLPLDLIINSKEVRGWISPDSASDAA